MGIAENEAITDELFRSAYSPENIIFIIDLDSEVTAPLNGTSGLSRLDAVKESLKSFAHIKCRLNPHHKIGIVTLKDAPEWRCMLTSDVSKLCATVNGLHAGERSYGRFNLAWLDNLVDKQHLDEEWQRGVMTRFVLLYSRSNIIPECTAVEGRSTELRMDLLYLHRKPAAGVNRPQQVYDELIRHMDDWAFKLEFNSYIFEAPASNSAPQKIKKYMAWLLSHPLQRVHQEQLPKPLDITRLPILDAMAALTIAQ